MSERGVVSVGSRVGRRGAKEEQEDRPSVEATGYGDGIVLG